MEAGEKRFVGEVFTNNNHPLFHKDKIKIFFKHKQAKSTNVHEKPTNANNSPTESVIHPKNATLRANARALARNASKT